MKLLVDLFRYIIRNLATLLLILFILILAAFFADQFQSKRGELALKMSEVSQLFDKKNEIKVELERNKKRERKLDDELSKDKRKIEKAEQAIDSLKIKAPSRFRHPLKYYALIKSAEYVQSKLNLEKVQQGKKNRLEQIKILSSTIKTQQADVDKLNAVYDEMNDPVISFLTISKIYWKRFLLLGIAILYFPILLRAVAYYQVANRAEKFKPIKLLSLSDNDAVQVGSAAKSVDVYLEKGDSLIARSEWVNEWDGTQRPKGKLLWSKSNPFTSYASGLAHLYHFHNNPKGEDEKIRIVIGSKLDMSCYVLPLKLENHPGFVVKPSHIVATSGNLKMFTVWNVRSATSWLIGKFRNIVIKGTGTIYLIGYGGVSANNPSEKVVRIEESQLVGFDGQLQYFPARRESAMGSIFRKMPIVDIALTGSGLYVRQISTASKSEKFLRSKFDSILSVLGKLLGF